MKATCLLYDSKGEAFEVPFSYIAEEDDRGDLIVKTVFLESELQELSSCILTDVALSIELAEPMYEGKVRISYCEILPPIEEKLTITKAA